MTTFCHLDFDYHPTSDQEGATNLIYSVLARSASKGHGYRSVILLSLLNAPLCIQARLCPGSPKPLLRRNVSILPVFTSIFIRNLIYKNMIFHANCLQATIVSIVGYEIKILGEMQPAQGGIWNVTGISIITGEYFLRIISCWNLHLLADDYCVPFQEVSCF